MSELRWANRAVRVLVADCGNDDLSRLELSIASRLANERDPAGRVQVWAGPECTVNRVGDEYFDQVVRTGHETRLDDLDRLAELGVQAVRYPVLWERHATNPIDWTWSDARLARLRELGIRPIVGLLHHGSGPPHTSLVDNQFPEGLAEFAGQVARRYPWIDAYTPVNEPLTTARFSGLYGHWHPHGRDDETFARCLLNECRAVVLSMEAIRRIHPGAELIQTEDLGKTHATRRLQYQADFENERRWLTWDLLCGRVTPQHTMWSYLQWAGIDEAEIGWFMVHPCPPDVLGVNYYVTSERFLDHRLHHYPSELHGGGENRYVDTEAVRMLSRGTTGLYRLLAKAWQRYQLPIAVTEVHLGCTVDEQMRWLWEVWRSAGKLRAKGVDVVAITSWSVFGAFDWNSLVTCSMGHYEPGAFDVSFDPPRPTRVADLLRDLARGRTPDYPELETLGWWRQPERLHPVARSRTRVVCP